MIPKRYSLSVEVKLIELPNQFDPPEEPLMVSDDPMKTAADLMGKMVSAASRPAMPWPEQPAGMNFHKSATVTVNGFGGLADIVLKFDELTTQIEAERP